MKVGNLLIDPTAQSFISEEDATTFLAPEMRANWNGASVEEREAALVRASRWLAETLAWYWPAGWSENQLAQVGKVAARLAVEALTVDLYQAVNDDKRLRSVKAGSAEIQYFYGRARSHAAGKTFPWLYPMLSGLVLEPGPVKPVVRA